MRILKRATCWFVNEGRQYTYLIAYISVTIYLAASEGMEFGPGTRFHTVVTLLDPVGVAIAKSAASVLRFNSTFILLPMCRVTLTFLAKLPIRILVPSESETQLFHILSAGVIVLGSFAHVLAHYYNLYLLSKSTTSTSLWYSFGSGVGITGQLAVLFLFLVVTSAPTTVRRKKFELFYYTHFIVFLFLIVLMPHGAFCFVKADVPPTCTIGGKMWTAVVIGLSVYFGDRLWREIRARRFTPIRKIVKHPGGVLELQVQKTNLSAMAGQYVSIMCPAISVLQWHPFTVTSGPNDALLTVHINACGDWTKEFSRLFGVYGNKPSISRDKCPRIYIDGPLGVGFELWRKYDVLILIAGGIGATPFANILKSVAETTKMYFIWVCRVAECFEWFQHLLKQMEECKNVKLEIYLTQNLDIDQIFNIVLNANDANDIVTGLQTNTRYGRPNWDTILSNLEVSHPNDEIGVFFCGPNQMAKEIKRKCEKHSRDNSNNVQFYFTQGRI